MVVFWLNIVCACLILGNFLCRDQRNTRAILFDGIEEGGIRASSSYSSHEIENDNERAIDGLQDRVILLKRVKKFLAPSPFAREVTWRLLQNWRK